MMNVLESMWRGDIALPDSACRQNNETKELGRLISAVIFGLYNCNVKHFISPF